MAFRADPPFPQELRLLAAALGPDRQRAAAMLQAGWPDVDFPLLYALAQRHRVVPGLAHALAHGGLLPPPPYQDMPGATLSHAAFHELALAAATGQLVGALQQDGMAPIILKGVPLSLRLHGRLGLRVSRDIDMLIPAASVGAALDRLEAEGYRPIPPFDRRQLPSIIRSRKDVELVSDDGRQIVELHWRLFDNPRLLALAGRPPTDRTELPGGQSCLVMADGFNLLYLANHGAQHGWSRLKWLADFAGLAHKLGAESCATLYAETSHSHGRRALGQALVLGNELLGLPMPAELAADLGRDARLRALIGTARHILTGSGTSEIEDMRFGSTRKNLSHYLIRSSPDYLLAEAWFDLNQFSVSEQGSPWHRFGPFGRVLSWGRRRLLAPGQKD